MIKGFEVRLNKTSEGQSLYITNRLASGKISLIVADEKPSVGDVEHTALRWDITEERFAELWERVQHKIEAEEDDYTVTEAENEPILSDLREEMIETPEIAYHAERAVKRPRGRRPRVPKPVLK